MVQEKKVKQTPAIERRLVSLLPETTFQIVNITPIEPRHSSFGIGM